MTRNAWILSPISVILATDLKLEREMKKALITLVMAALLAVPAASADPTDKTRLAFDHYIATVDANVQKQHSSPPTFLGAPPTDARLRSGEVLIEKITAPAIPDGLIHHWKGTAFIASASLPQMIAVAQDYDSFAMNFQPEVLHSALLAHKGDDFRFSMRLQKHKVITVVLDTISDVHFGQLDPDHRFSVARMNHITEVADTGERTEHTLTPGNDSGFLWSMDTYWSYVQVPDGVLLTCETVSLTRDVPFGLKYVIGPFMESVPRESLEFTLKATRTAVQHLAAVRR